MKTLLTILALASILSGAALANQPTGGISGYVTDVKTGRPIANATVLYYKSPYVENVTVLQKLVTDRHGFYSDITLEPGRYVVMARFPDKVQGCAVDDVMGGETAHIKITMGHDQIMCSGPRVHPALVDPNTTADVYRI
jgi:protocatechuate 3,4-dioxygenase beta subunit